MSHYTAKVMSKENLPDSDARKAHTLYPVPANCYVEFRRSPQTQQAELHFVSEESGLPSTCVPLTDCGNVYILVDGKTVSSFNPNPVQSTLDLHRHTSQLEVSGERITLTNSGQGFLLEATQPLVTTKPKSEPIKADGMAVLEYTLYLLNLLASPSVFPFAETLNREIANFASLEGRLINAAGVEFELSHVDTDTATFQRYLNRVNDALLNDRVKFTVQSIIGQRKERLLAVAPTPTGTPFSQTERQWLLDHEIPGLVQNHLERAIKLLGYGAKTVVLDPPVIVSDSHREHIKTLFKKRDNVTIKFVQQGDKTIQLIFQ